MKYKKRIFPLIFFCELECGVQLYVCYLGGMQSMSCCLVLTATYIMLYSQYFLQQHSPLQIDYFTNLVVKFLPQYVYYIGGSLRESKEENGGWEKDSASYGIYSPVHPIAILERLPKRTMINYYVV